MTMYALFSLFFFSWVFLVLFDCTFACLFVRLRCVCVCVHYVCVVYALCVCVFVVCAGAYVQVDVCM